jgi:hypothetical protein
MIDELKNIFYLNKNELIITFKILQKKLRNY